MIISKLINWTKHYGKQRGCQDKKATTTYFYAKYT